MATYRAAVRFITDRIFTIEADGEDEAQDKLHDKLQSEGDYYNCTDCQWDWITMPKEKE